MCKIQHTRSIILGLTTRFKHLKRTKCVCGRGIAQTPLVELTALPRLAIWLMGRSGGKGRGRKWIIFGRKIYLAVPDWVSTPPLFTFPGGVPRLATFGSASGRGNTG